MHIAFTQNLGDQMNPNQCVAIFLYTCSNYLYISKQYGNEITDKYKISDHSGLDYQNRKLVLH
jgi:hypothetical protein